MEYHEKQLEVSTYTMWDVFRNCQKLYELRYLYGLVPNERPDTLTFGGLVHDALADWYNMLASWDDVVDREDRWKARIRKAASEEKVDRVQAMLAFGMVEGYTRRYIEEDRNIKIVAVEKVVEGKINNPKSRGQSQTFRFKGKVDLIFEEDGELWIMEHKTASRIDMAYIDRLWMDFQIALYKKYVEETYGRPVVGVMYNALLKTQVRPKKGETVEEFEARRAALLAKSKTGKSNAKQQHAETKEEFMRKLYGVYSNPDMFHREPVLFDEDSIVEMESQLWELTQAMLHSRRRQEFYRNTGYCYKWNRACQFLPICKSGENPNVIGNLYHVEEPFAELEDDANGD